VGDTGVPWDGGKGVPEGGCNSAAYLAAAGGVLGVDASAPDGAVSFFEGGCEGAAYLAAAGGGIGVDVAAPDGAVSFFEVCNALKPPNLFPPRPALKPRNSANRQHRVHHDVRDVQHTRRRCEITHQTSYEEACDKRRRDTLRRDDETDDSQCPSSEAASMAVYAATHAPLSVSAAILERTSMTLAPTIAASARSVALVLSIPVKSPIKSSRFADASVFAVAADADACVEAADAVSAFERAVDAATRAASAMARAASAAASLASRSPWRYATASAEPSGGMGGDGWGGGGDGVGGG
jgi:hypothetical protein